MDPVDKAFAEMGGLEMPPPFWMDDNRPRAKIRDNVIRLTVPEHRNTRRESQQRLQGQAEGLVVGLLLAGFFGLLLNWSF